MERPTDNAASKQASAWMLLLKIVLVFAIPVPLILLLDRLFR